MRVSDSSFPAPDDVPASAGACLRLICENAYPLHAIPAGIPAGPPTESGPLHVAAAFPVLQASRGDLDALKCKMVALIQLGKVKEALACIEAAPKQPASAANGAAGDSAVGHLAFEKVRGGAGISYYRLPAHCRHHLPLSPRRLCSFLALHGWQSESAEAAQWEGKVLLAGHRVLLTNDGPSRLLNPCLPTRMTHSGCCFFFVHVFMWHSSCLVLFWLSGILLLPPEPARGGHQGPAERREDPRGSAARGPGGWDETAFLSPHNGLALGCPAQGQALCL